MQMRKHWQHPLGYNRKGCGKRSSWMYATDPLPCLKLPKENHYWGWHRNTSMHPKGNLAEFWMRMRTFCFWFCFIIAKTQKRTAMSGLVTNYIGCYCTCIYRSTQTVIRWSGPACLILCALVAVCQKRERGRCDLSFLSAMSHQCR